ncbi:SHOCT domain-containing protein [Actinoallomurus sp. NPDC050550]|uniref:SHOCT domain-containing protein n=1 Tax=Actinoallomurus sp. NPDC050550 TaxID=3154937 RepID=UPI0033C7E2C9
MYWYDGHMSGWGYGLMTFSTVLFWVLLIVIIIALVRYLGHVRQPNVAPPPDITPEQLLAERFARGEIDTDEYRERLETLRSGVDPPSVSRAT